jgi:fatty acid desaturase
MHFKNNLEDIHKQTLVNSSGLSYTEFRKTLVPKWTIVWRDILVGYLALFVVVYLSIFIGNSGSLLIQLCSFPIITILIGFFIANLQLFVHEAAHFNIHPNKKYNDKLANIFLCAVTGINIKSYRKIHWDHHLYLGTTKDTETSYFNAPTLSFILQTLTGIHALKIIWGRKKKIDAIATQTVVKKNQRTMFIVGILLNVSIVMLCLYFNYCFLLFSWVAGIGVAFPFFGAIRQLLEHRSETAEEHINYFEKDHGKLSRYFKKSIFSYFMGGAGFNRHMVHHWDPQVSYTCFDEMEQYLLTTAACSDILKQSETTYLKTFLKLTKS